MVRRFCLRRERCERREYNQSMPRKQSKTRRGDRDCVVVSLFDRHAASKMAPINPATRLEDLSTGKAQRIGATAVSEMLWEPFGVEWPDEVRRIAGGRPIDIIDGGDPTQGNKHPEELYATSPAQQVEIARMQIDPWLRLPGVRSVLFTAGTGSHEFGEGAATQSLAAIVSSMYTKIGKVRSAYHYLATIGGLPFDIAHHGPSAGRSEWTRDNGARSYARGIMIDDLLDGKRPPAAILRGHIHVPLTTLVDVRDNWSWMCVNPSMQYPNDYARKAARSPARFTFGVTVFDIRGGEIHGRPIRLWKTVDTRTEVVTDYD